jgi:hypothetical protein
MAYRTLVEPGNDAAGKPLLGLKITTTADICMNRGGISRAGKKADAQKKIKELRAGSGSTGEGTYRVNSIVCYHNKVGGTKHAVAWHYDKTTKPTYVIVEGFLEHGAGNSYTEMS